MEKANIVQTLCDLSEASGEVFRESLIECRERASLQLLTALGAIMPGPPLTTVTCTACAADHSEIIEHDEKRCCYFHFCPDAGLVTVADADLITHEFRPEWLADWLVTALPIRSPPRLSVLVPREAWHLGDTVCGDTVITVVFARRIAILSGLDRLASALRPIHRADKGLVLTTSLNVARQVALPGGYEVLRLPDIVHFSQGGLALDHMRLGSWIRGMQPATAKGAPTRIGRPSPATRISQIYDLRRSRGLPVESDSAEAAAILAEWRQHAPDQNPPGHSTVRRHVAQVTKANAST